MLKTEILRIATLMAEEPNEVSRSIYLDQLSELLGDTQAESLVLAAHLRQFKRAWDAAQPGRIDFDEWVEISAKRLEENAQYITAPAIAWHELTQAELELEQLKRVHEATLETWAKQTKDLHFFLEQSIIIEHKQDHEKMRKLRKEYGYDF